MIDGSWNNMYHTMAKDVCKASFKHFVQEFWDCIVMEPLVWNWHMEHICDNLQYRAEMVCESKPKKNDLIINVPPGSSKSLLTSVFFPAWAWLKKPSLRFICCSYSSSLSVFLSMRCRDLLKHDKYMAYFPHVRIRKAQDAKSYFELSMGGFRFATSVGATVTGYHGHFLLVDDPVSPDEALSDTQIRANNFWLENTLMQRCVDKGVAQFVLIMQRLHENDPTGYFLEKKLPFEHICLPAELTDDVKPKSAAKNYIDGLLDPQRMPRGVLDSIRKRGEYTYAGQYLQTPKPLGGALFKVDNFIMMPSPPIKMKKVIRYWDKAGTEGGDGPYTVGTKIGRCMDDSFIVLDVIRGRWAVEQRERIIRRTAERDGVDTHVYIEQEPGSGGQESAQATIKNLSGFSVFADSPKGDKEKRAVPFAVQVNNGNVYVLKAGWNSEFISEFSFFPFSKFKDQVDSASGAFAKLNNYKRCGSW